MFREDRATLSTRHDHAKQGIPSPYFIESHEAYDQQRVAASNARYSLSQFHGHDSLENGSTKNQNDSCFHSSRTLSSFPTYGNTIWDDRHTCPAPPAPEHANSWEFEAHGHVAYQNPASHYPNQGYGESAMSSLLTARGLHPLVPLQQHTPPSDTSTGHFSGSSTPLPSLRASNRSFNSTPASSVELNQGGMDYHTPLIGAMNRSTESINGAPYAKLIERALLEAEGNRLLLKDIYNWIEINTDKASNPASNGWKNSVRHNLSMNGAFRKIEVRSPKEKCQRVYMWMLEPSAKEHGIESTTRFRRKNDTKRRSRTFAVNDRRAQSGRRGGRASHKSAQLRRDSQLAATWHSPQHSEHEKTSISGYSSYETPKTALPVFATAGYYQPSLSSPPPQHFSSQVADGHSFDEPTSMGLEPTTQLTSYQSDAIQPMWPALTSPLTHHHPSGYSNS